MFAGPSELIASQIMGSRSGLATTENGVRVKTNFISRFNVIWVVQSRSKKYSTFRRPQISGLLIAVPHP
jgi:hypothetical protein